MIATDYLTVGVSENLGLLVLVALQAFCLSGMQYKSLSHFVIKNGDKWQQVVTHIFCRSIEFIGFWRVVIYRCFFSILDS